MHLRRAAARGLCPFPPPGSGRGSVDQLLVRVRAGSPVLTQPSSSEGCLESAVMSQIYSAF